MAVAAANPLTLGNDRQRGSRHATVMALVPLSLGLLFFLTGYFEFFSFLGLGLVLQIALIGVLGLLAPPILLPRMGRFIREPLFLICTVLFAVELIVRRESASATLGMAGAAFFVALVFALGMRFANRTLQIIVVVAGIFAVMSVIQFAFLALDYDLVWHTINPNYVLVEYTTNPFSPVEFVAGHFNFGPSNPIGMLGMTTGREFLFGSEVPRVFSFAREPGLLVVYFFLPGVLALTWPGPWRWLAVPLFLASMLAFTGTVLASTIAGVGLLLFAKFIPQRRHEQVLTWVPTLLILAGTYLLYFTGVFDWVLWMMFRSPATPLGHEAAQVVDFYEPAMLRITQARTLAAALISGSEARVPGAIGLLVYGFIKAHVVGAALFAAFLYGILRTVAGCWGQGCPAVPAALLAGTFVQAGVFQQYGFTTPAAFLFCALILMRLRSLRTEATPSSMGPHR